MGMAPGFTTAMNAYHRNYNAINGAAEPNSPNAFPIEEFNKLKRTVRTRGYKQQARQRQNALS